MYPGPEKSPLNHKRGICADGVKSTSTADSADHLLPDWPQPHGIFSDGSTFHASAFLQMVQQVYETMVTGTSPNTPVIELQAFLQMLVARSVVLSDADGHPTMVLFRLYPGFNVDDSVSGDRIVQHEGADHLRINYLEQEASPVAV